MWVGRGARCTRAANLQAPPIATPKPYPDRTAPRASGDRPPRVGTRRGDGDSDGDGDADGDAPPEPQSSMRTPSSHRSSAPAA
eukprot:7377989-Prymnesium_polylepis.2